MLKKAYVEITNRCNLACSFCPKTKRAPRTMSAQEFGLVLSRLEGYVQYVYLHVMGEPLLHPELTTLSRPRQGAGHEDLHHDERHAAPKAFR
ncbi:MAG: hypothetical protein ACLRSD_08135 [Oscillibacter sp.]